MGDDDSWNWFLFWGGIFTMTRATTHLKNIKVNDEYGTPKNLFEIACMKYGIFPLIDICASFTNHVLPNFISKESNCFKHYINEDFFMNPPYSQIYKFMSYAYEQHRKFNVNALILTFAKVDTKWWHEFVEDYAEVHFIRGRIQFNDHTGNPTTFFDKKTQKLKNGHAPYPSCWIIFRKKGDLTVNA